MYGKVFSSMWTGSMFGAGPVVFAVWAYAISCCDKEGIVELNPKLLASILGCSVSEVTDAISYLCNPDSESRTKAEDGRRIVKMGSFCYYLVNFKHYHDLRKEEERREQNKKSQQTARDKMRESSAKVSESQQPSAELKQASSQQESAESAHTDTDTYTDTDTENRTQGGNHPPCVTVLVEYCSKVLGWNITESEARGVWDYYAPPDGDGVWRMASGRKVSDWRKCCVTCRARHIEKNKAEGMQTNEIHKTLEEENEIRKAMGWLPIDADGKVIEGPLPESGEPDPRNDEPPDGESHLEPF
jgi:hypothetical protein